MNVSLLFVIAITELILKYGLPGALKVIADWKVDDPTIDDINALRARVKKPEEYFDEPTG